MERNHLSLFIEINNLDLTFLVGESNKEESFKNIYNHTVKLEGFENNKISDLEKVFKIFKENIFLIEEKFNFTFKEIILILENFNPTFLNLTGYKKLNGSQILKENITYILNTLKACLEETEPKKNIIHIFNSKFLLDKKKIENLPIGLFGDFYSHELSFILIDSNDYKNLENIFQKCNLKIKKILLKSFAKGAHISNKNKNIDTFFQIQINESNSKIFYFENNSLKFEQNFKFGTNIIIRDISKITSLKIETVKMILDKVELNDEIPNDDLIEEKLFINEFNKKIKKRLVYEIALARIKEISELILYKNINLKYLIDSKNKIFLEISDNFKSQSVNEILRTVFSQKNRFQIQLLNNLESEEMITTVNKLVHFGWKKEAIPIAHSKKSLIARFFEAIFD